MADRRGGGSDLDQPGQADAEAVVGAHDEGVVDLGVGGAGVEGCRGCAGVTGHGLDRGGAGGDRGDGGPGGGLAGPRGEIGQAREHVAVAVDLDGGLATEHGDTVDLLLEAHGHPSGE